jgi:hypothetical protein
MLGDAMNVLLTPAREFVENFMEKRHTALKASD